MSIHRDLRRVHAYSKKSSSPYALVQESVEVLPVADCLMDRWIEPDSLVKEEAARQAFEDRSVGELLSFEEDACSPYYVPLDGQEYYISPSLGMDGMCPVCNNAKSRELDSFYIRTYDDRKRWKERGFPEDVVLTHLVLHVGLVYAEAVDAAHQGIADNGHEYAGPVNRALRTDRLIRKKQARNREHEGKFHRVDAPAPTLATPLAPGKPGKMKPAGAVAHRWYAFDGDRQQGQLRPWGGDRMENELEKKRTDAIVFYDEMVDVRRMARRVYDEIMDTELVPEVLENGKTRYVERNYSAAIAAVREIKGVAMDMAKLALIATKIGDEKDRVRQISPSMRDMLDEIGIFSPGQDDGAMRDVNG